MNRTDVVPAQYASQLGHVLDKLNAEIQSGAIPEAFRDKCRPGEVIELRWVRSVPNQADALIAEAIAKSGIKLVRTERTFADVKADRARRGIK